jgi:hypothetical protein
MDEQTVFTEPRRIADEAIRAVEPVGVLIAHPFDLTPHVLTAVHLQLHFLLRGLLCSRRTLHHGHILNAIRSGNEDAFEAPTVDVDHRLPVLVATIVAPHALQW